MIVQVFPRKPCLRVGVRDGIARFLDGAQDRGHAEDAGGRVLGEFSRSRRRNYLPRTIELTGAKYSQWRSVLNEVLLIDRGPKLVMVELDPPSTATTSPRYGRRRHSRARRRSITDSPATAVPWSIPRPCAHHPHLPPPLSFRPIVLLDSVVVTIRCPANARNTAWPPLTENFKPSSPHGDATSCRLQGRQFPHSRRL